MFIIDQSTLESHGSTKGLYSAEIVGFHKQSIHAPVDREDQQIYKAFQDRASAPVPTVIVTLSTRRYNSEVSTEEKVAFVDIHTSSFRRSDTTTRAEVALEWDTCITTHNYKA